VRSESRRIARRERRREMVSRGARPSAGGAAKRDKGSCEECPQAQLKSVGTVGTSQVRRLPNIRILIPGIVSSLPYNAAVAGTCYCRVVRVHVKVSRLSIGERTLPGQPGD